jgi:hypothetical protein
MWDTVAATAGRNAGAGRQTAVTVTLKREHAVLVGVVRLDEHTTRLHFRLLLS